MIFIALAIPLVLATIGGLVYLQRGRAKVEIGLARGKRLYDRREDIAKRTAERDVERAMSER